LGRGSAHSASPPASMHSASSRRLSRELFL
jgi:hypothetical protein